MRSVLVVAGCGPVAQLLVDRLVAQKYAVLLVVSELREVRMIDGKYFQYDSQVPGDYDFVVREAAKSSHSLCAIIDLSGGVAILQCPPPLYVSVQVASRQPRHHPNVLVVKIPPIVLAPPRPKAWVNGCRGNTFRSREKIAHAGDIARFLTDCALRNPIALTYPTVRLGFEANLGGLAFDLIHVLTRCDHFEEEFPPQPDGMHMFGFSCLPIQEAVAECVSRTS